MYYQQPFIKKIPARPEAHLGLEKHLGVLAKIQHRNVVALRTVARVHGGFVVHMRHYHAISAGELAERRHPLNWRDAADLIDQALVGLRQLHERGLAHGDATLGHLLVDDHGDGYAVHLLPTGGLGRRGAAPGRDRRADLRELGRGFIRLVTGAAPNPAPPGGWRGATPAPAELLHPGLRLPASLTRWAGRMTAPDPADGYPSATPALAALRAAADLGEARLFRPY